jgi:hypothetical protein
MSSAVCPRLSPESRRYYGDIHNGIANTLLRANIYKSATSLQGTKHQFRQVNTIVLYEKLRYSFCIRSETTQYPT